jgi:hypothetical protein
MSTKKINKKNRKTRKLTDSMKSSNYFKSICNDSHYCISFGIEQKKINDFFDNFIHFTYGISPVKTINQGNNGIIKKLIYERRDYQSYAIIKFQLKKTADSLLYEYLIGCFVNQYTRLLPSFIHTYGLYRNNFLISKLKKNNLSIQELKKNLTYINNIDLLKPSFDVGCKYSLAVLLEHISPTYTLDNFIENISFYKNFFKIELINCLYQLYYSLAVLSNNFTHYDLHLGNVLYYRPKKDGYITFFYHHRNNKITSFCTQYIVKIIDYGRCYFYDNKTNISSLSLLQDLCTTKQCDPNCGERFGFNWLNKSSTARNYFISSKVNNKSHDLRYLYETNRKLNKLQIDITEYNPSLHHILSRILYGVDIKDEKEKRYGSKEIYKDNIKEYEKLYPNTIKNVIEAKEELQKCVETNKEYFKTLHKIGELHIYENGMEMKYIPL